MSSDCHGIHANQLLSVLSAVGARQSWKNLCSITWQVHVLPLSTSALTEPGHTVPAITLML